MGFLSGRVSFERFEVSGRDFNQFDQQHVDILDNHAIGKFGAMAADGIEMGFTAGGHILDLGFSLEKNIYNDAMHAALRVDTNKIPGDLLKAYMQMELDVLAANNPSGYPSRQQRMLARETAQQRCEDEAKTGKFRRMSQVPFLWDLRSHTLFFGSSSLNAIERFLTLYKAAFGRTLTRVTAGSLAHDLAVEMQLARSLEDLSPSSFADPRRKITVAWVQDQFGSRDFLGNEFLMWLWWTLEVQGDTLRLLDGSEATLMLNKTLSLECPLAETGKETISSEAPTRLPEAKRAILAGKWPRKSGMILVREDRQFEFTLQGETLAVGSASLPKLESEAGRAEIEDRMDLIRELRDSIDRLYEVFLKRRLSASWNDDLQKLRLWLSADN